MMTSNKAILFSIILIIISITSISFQYFLDDPENVPAGDSIWELHWEFSFINNSPDSLVRIATPIDTRFTQVFEQNISVQNMKIQPSRQLKDGTREVLARGVQQGETSLTIDFAIHLSALGNPHFITNEDNLNSTRRQNYLASTETLPANDERIIQLIKTLGDKLENPEKLFNSIFDYSTRNIKFVDQADLVNVHDIISSQKANVLGKVRLLTTLARAAKIPARVVTGILLDESSDVNLHYWVEVNVAGKWLGYDPTEGYIQEMPQNYIPIRKDGEFIVMTQDSINLDYSILEVVERDLTASLMSQPQKNLLDIFDLNRLSLTTRLTLASLMLLPIGALFTVFVRQIVGPNVYGTFTPTFIAGAFNHVGWKTGSIIVVLVVIIGFLGRWFASHLGLNRVSRLTFVFILVAISMIFSVSLLVFYGIVPDGNVVLLPIVILTFMIDRIYTLADSDGSKVALIRLFWTFIVSVFVVSILQLNLFGLWLLEYPEAHFITAALVILISQYKGNPWMRNSKLQWMLEPKSKKKTKEKIEDPIM